MTDIFVSITKNGETSTYVTVDLRPGTACLIDRGHVSK